MFTEIIVNVHPHEKRVAIMEDNRLVELFAEKKDKQMVVGNIYKGVVKNVLPGMGAAFVDIGLSRTAFLHYKDIFPELLLGNKKVRIGRDSSKISEILSPGDEIIVQVKKDPIGKKGARVTGKVSVPGKFLVYIPEERKIAISRKITSVKERKRIKSILKPIKEKNVGVIVRTDTEAIENEDFKKEYDGLMKTWKLVKKQLKYSKSPACLFNQSDLSHTLIRDLFNSNVERLVVDDKKLCNQIIRRINDSWPEFSDRVELYQEDSPIFDAYGIEKEIKSIFKSRIPLPSGGNITIEQTEALVAIDVNTGSFTGNNNYDETIKKTNLEAAFEAARQIRLRDLSGIMIIDFIDMRYDDHKDEVYAVLRNTMRRDQAKHKVYPFSALGLVEISRRRTRPSLLLTYSESCPYCNGTGRLLSRDSVAVQISRWLKRAQYFIKDDSLKIVVHKNVKEFFEKNMDILKDIGNHIEFEVDSKIKFDTFKVFSLKTGKEITLKYSA
ncbi:MAG: Rne/Rng family ribonuclease [Candidatus Cloacimonetes bacterium]|nr:Rne/Rng family ribonuclease [Candidatus Cloacimonadota bacterium]